jgi:hypothetical protein
MICRLPRRWRSRCEGEPPLSATTSQSPRGRRPRGRTDSTRPDWVACHLASTARHHHVRWARSARDGGRRGGAWRTWAPGASVRKPKVAAVEVDRRVDVIDDVSDGQRGHQLPTRPTHGQGRLPQAVVHRSGRALQLQLQLQLRDDAPSRRTDPCGPREAVHHFSTDVSRVRMWRVAPRTQSRTLAVVDRGVLLSRAVSLVSRAGRRR